MTSSESGEDDVVDVLGGDLEDEGAGVAVDAELASLPWPGGPRLGGPAAGPEQTGAPEGSALGGEALRSSRCGLLPARSAQGTARALRRRIRTGFGKQCS